MSSSRVAITLEFQARSLTGEEYTVEEYTYFHAEDDPNNIQRPGKKMFSLNDPVLTTIFSRLITCNKMCMKLDAPANVSYV